MTSKVALAQAFFEGTEIITTVENTYRPELNGTRRRITKAGKSFFDAVLLDDTAPYGSLGKVQRAGTACRGNIPTRAADVVEITETTLTTRLGDMPRLEGHTVTYRKEPA